MDCARVKKWMLEGGDRNAAEVQQHLTDCDACRALYADGTSLARLLAAEHRAKDVPLALPSLVDIEKEIARDHRSWRRLAELSTRVRWAVALAAAAVPVLAGALRHRHNLSAYPLGRLTLELAAMAGVVLTSLWLWLRPLNRPQPRHRVLWAVLLLALVLPSAVAIAPAALPDSGHAAGIVPSGELHRALACFLFGTLTAAPALAVAVGLGRRASGFPGFSLLPAVAAALAGVLGLHLHCPEVAFDHLLLGHVSIVWALPLLLALADLIRRRRQAA